MKIDRRGFLSFVAGGTVGTVLSPLPWKLMDDVSIWSQVWPWVPVPKSGESKYVKSTCSLCNKNCGVSVRKIEDRAVKIEGLDCHPVNDGGICALGLSGLQFLYSPSRIKTPMKRVGAEGFGQWCKISWEEGISTVVDKLISIRDGKKDNGGVRVACLSGLSDGTVLSLIKRFFKAYGLHIFLDKYSSSDILSLVLKDVIQSEEKISVDFDLESSDYILSLGSGLFDGWLSPVKMVKLKENLEKGSVELVQIDSMYSNTAAKASRWVPINPGTESDLMFGIASILIKNDYYDSDFVNNCFPKFNEWKEIFLKKYDLDVVSRNTGVSVEVILNLAERFSKSISPLVLCGRGKGDLPSASRDYVSVCLLNFLKGNINKPGGMIARRKVEYLKWPSIGTRDCVKSNGNSERFRNINDNDPFYSVSKFVSDLSSKKIVLDALFIVDANPVYNSSDVLSGETVFSKIPLVVSFSSFMDETTAKSNLILPSNTYLERFEERDLSNELGKSALGFLQPVVSSVFDTRHIGDVFIDVAHSVGGNIGELFPWKDYNECLKSTVGGKINTMADEGFWIGDKYEPIEISKFDFYKFTFSTIHYDSDINSFPLLLVPYDFVRISSGYYSTPPFLVKTIPDTILKDKSGYVDINPNTANEIGLKKDDFAILSTSKGTARVRINLSDGVIPGVITMVRGLGHSAYDEYIAGKGVNINSLVGYVEDSIYGYDVSCGIRAKLTKA